METVKSSKNIYLKAVKRLSNKLHLKTNFGNTKIESEKRAKKKVLLTEEDSESNKKIVKNRNRSLEGKYEEDNLTDRQKKNSSWVDLKAVKTWETEKLPYAPAYVIRFFSSALTFFEQEEILEYRSIYYIAQNVHKFDANSELTNNGFDDDRSDYVLIKHDHIAYRYEILEILGRGSYGQVIKAYDHKEKILVAIKIIRNISCILRQGRIEVQILNKLNQYETICEHIINILDSFMFRSHICIVFELLRMNLYQFQATKGFKAFPSQVLKIFTQQVLTGIRFFHNLGILHCDLKPENIMVCNNLSSFKIIDFGSGCFSNKRIFTYIQSRYYRAPEVILEVGYNGLIDIWSFGCILVELVTGKLVFIGKDEMEMIGSIVEVLGMPPGHMLERSGKKPQMKEYLKRNFSGKGQKSIAKRPIRDLIVDSPKLADLITSKEYLECLCWDPTERITAEDALKHEWLHKEIKHICSLPVLKTERSSSMIKLPEHTPRKIFQINESRKKSFIQQDSPKKSFSNYFLN